MKYIINIKADSNNVNRSENTSRFYRDIRKYKPMNKEEEIEWFTLLKKGTPAQQRRAREHIIKCNQRLLISAAKNYATTDNLTDYINEANFGLMEAIEKFDVSKGIKFASYAMWFILRSINQFKYDTLQMVKKTNYSKTFHIMAKARSLFYQEHERYPSDDELLQLINTHYGKQIKDKADLVDMKIAHIDVQSNEESEAISYSDVNDFNRTSASYNAYEKNVHEEFNNTLLHQLMSKLTDREKEIIMLRYGLIEDNGLKYEHDLADIANKLGITSERVRQLCIEALKKMQKASQTISK